MSGAWQLTREMGMAPQALTEWYKTLMAARAARKQAREVELWRTKPSDALDAVLKQSDDELEADLHEREVEEQRADRVSKKEKAVHTKLTRSQAADERRVARNSLPHCIVCKHRIVSQGESPTARYARGYRMCIYCYTHKAEHKIKLKQERAIEKRGLCPACKRSAISGGTSSATRLARKQGLCLSCYTAGHRKEDG